MRVYLDSSALVKRVLDEPESDALEVALARYGEAGTILLSSTLAWVEVTRAVRLRLEAEPPAEVAKLVDRALAGITACPLSEQVVSVAERLGPTTLRSLDAIHLASAALLNIDLVCAYDQRMLTAAAELGFRTISPA